MVNAAIWEALRKQTDRLVERVEKERATVGKRPPESYATEARLTREITLNVCVLDLHNRLLAPTEGPPNG